MILVVLKLDRPLSGKIIFLIVILVQTSGAIDTKVQMQARDLRHYSLFSLMSAKLTLFTLFLIFETLFIIFVKLRHYSNKLDIIFPNRYELMQKVLVLALKCQF